MSEKKVGKAERKGSADYFGNQKVGKKVGQPKVETVKQISMLEVDRDGGRAIRGLTFSVVTFDDEIQEVTYIAVNCE